MNGFLEEVYRKLREAPAGDAEFAQPGDLGVGIASLPSWLLDPPDSQHNDASKAIGDLWLQSPEIGKAVSGAPWIQTASQKERCIAPPNPRGRE